MAVVPLVMIFEGDYAHYLLPADSGQTIAEVAAISADWCVPRHTPPRPGEAVRVRKAGAPAPFPPEMTVGEAGLASLDRIEVYFEGPAA